MDFPDTNNDIQLAMERAEAEARLRRATAPDRLNENWRFGRPHKYAAELMELLADKKQPNMGEIRFEGPEDAVFEMDEEMRYNELLMHSIGSDALLNLHLQRFGRGVCVFLEESPAKPIVIEYETEGLFCPSTFILAAPGVKAHIIERHICRGQGTMFCCRDIKAAEGAELSLELQEIGSGESSAMNISNIGAADCKLRQLTRHEGHAWAREETIAELLKGGQQADVQLFSANRLDGTQVLDQHTQQIHRDGGAYSNLLYKNVIDGKATATFAGNIYVAAAAHNTDAYQSNRNMLLSEDATVNSLPGLEILADHVRCSHGSASAPMDEEQLFYLLSRGVPRHEAQLLVAEGFLEDVLTQFHGEVAEAETESPAQD